MIRSFILGLSLLLTSCSTVQTVYVPTYPEIPADLLVSCKELKLIEKGDGKTLAPWVIDTVTKYKECSASKQALVEIIKN